MTRLMHFIASAYCGLTIASLLAYGFLGVRFWTPLPNDADGFLRAWLIFTAHSIGLAAGALALSARESGK